jgi:hypothetical protein
LNSKKQSEIVRRGKNHKSYENFCKNLDEKKEEIYLNLKPEAEARIFTSFVLFRNDKLSNVNIKHSYPLSFNIEKNKI